VVSHVQYGRALTVYDLQNCQQSFAYGSWPATGSGYSFDGCENMDLFSSLSQAFPSIDLNYGTRAATLRFGVNSESITGFVSRKQLDGQLVHNRLNIQAFGTEPKTTEGYLAVGDSFASGEGDRDADWYEIGTDEQGTGLDDRNLCHLSQRSYPYLVAQTLGLINSLSTPRANGLFHSVACSGAASQHITDDVSQGAYIEKTPLNIWLPGINGQAEYITGRNIEDEQRNPIDPEVITLSIGGNDFGVVEHLLPCLAPGTCAPAKDPDSANSVAQEIAKIKPKVVAALNSVKQAAPDARIYLLGYPRLFQASGGNCVGYRFILNDAERYYAGAVTHYINQVVESAAKQAGVFFVNVENILDGRNLCGTEVDKKLWAVNGLSHGNDRELVEEFLKNKGLISGSGNSLIPNYIGNESFHPNQMAQPLFRDRLLADTANLTISMPEPVETPVPTPDYYFTETPQDSSALDTTGRRTPEKRNIIVGVDSGRQLQLRADNLQPNTQVAVEAHSTPLNLGTFTVDRGGIIEAVVQLPPSLEPGYHEIHIKAKNYIGIGIDLYEPVIVASNDPNDIDGDGLPNKDDLCIFLSSVHEDDDSDGIDDGCDADLATQKTEEVVVETNKDGLNESNPWSQFSEADASEGASQESVVTLSVANTDTQPVQGSPEGRVRAESTEVQNTSPTDLSEQEQARLDEGKQDLGDFLPWLVAVAGGIIFIFALLHVRRLAKN
jgi:hypothetical protein